MKKYNRKAGISRLIFIPLFFCLLTNVGKASAETKEASRQELFNEAAVLKYIAVKNPQISDYLKDLKKKNPQEYFRTILLYENMMKAENNLDKNDNLACPECAAFAQRLKKEKPFSGREDEKKVLDYIRQNYPDAYKQIPGLREYSLEKYKKLLELYAKDMDAKDWLKINRPQALQQFTRQQVEVQSKAKQVQKLIADFAGGSISRRDALAELSKIFLPDLKQHYHPAYINLQISRNEARIKWLEANKRSRALPAEVCDKEINSLQSENKALGEALKGDFSGLALLQAERVLSASDAYSTLKK
jgi:hypothetical protein